MELLARLTILDFSDEAAVTLRKLKNIRNPDHRGRPKSKAIKQRSQVSIANITFESLLSSVSGDSEVLLKYLDYIERSLSRWADAVPSVRMPPGERPFGYMMTVRDGK